MTVCVIDFIEENYKILFKFAMNRSGGDRELSADAVSHAFIRANEPDIICKIYNEWWAYNRIKEYIRAYWKKRGKEREIITFIDWINEKGELLDFGEDAVIKEYLDFILDKVISFIRKRYPQSQEKYIHYFEICCYQKLTGDPWDIVQHNFPKLNIKEVQSRCSEILKEFRAYYLPRKRKKWK